MSDKNFRYLEIHEQHNGFLVQYRRGDGSSGSFVAIDHSDLHQLLCRIFPPGESMVKIWPQP